MDGLSVDTVGRIGAEERHSRVPVRGASGASACLYLARTRIDEPAPVVCWMEAKTPQARFTVRCTEPGELPPTGRPAMWISASPVQCVALSQSLEQGIVCAEALLRRTSTPATGDAVVRLSLPPAARVRVELRRSAPERSLELTLSRSVERFGSPLALIVTLADSQVVLDERTFEMNDPNARVRAVRETVAPHARDTADMELVSSGMRALDRAVFAIAACSRFGDG